MILSTAPNQDNLCHPVDVILNAQTRGQLDLNCPIPQFSQPRSMNQTIGGQGTSMNSVSQRQHEDASDHHFALVSRREKESSFSSRTAAFLSSPPANRFQLHPRFVHLKADENQDEAVIVKHEGGKDTVINEIELPRRGDQPQTFPLSTLPSHTRQEPWNSWKTNIPGTGTESWRRHFRPSKSGSGESHYFDPSSGSGRVETLAVACDSRSSSHHELTYHQSSRQSDTSLASVNAVKSQQWKWKVHLPLNRHLPHPGNRSLSTSYASNRFVSVRPTSGRGYHHTLPPRPYHKLEYPIRWSRNSPDTSSQERRHFPVFTNGESAGLSRSSRTPNVSLRSKTVGPTLPLDQTERTSDTKRPLSPIPPKADQDQLRQHSPEYKKAKGFDKLDLLCSATLEIGELYDNPTGCSCPKSKCIALYCDCFKAGRRCDMNKCKCLDCKNTVSESGAEGARTKAIRCILARNPRAFTTAGVGNPTLKLPPGEIACNCVRSRCLKLYCSCFQNGRICNPNVCTCVACCNTENDEEGLRNDAIQQYLEKKPDAFVVKKPKEVGLGCACKNNRCIRKYCECFRSNITCTSKCICRQCENGKQTESWRREVQCNETIENIESRHAINV